MEQTHKITTPFRWSTALLLLALALGCLLRLLWVMDMEYKADEIWTFEKTQNVGVTETFPWLGMPNSYDVRHPGGSIWVFLALNKIFHLDTPEALCRACQVLNCLAILVFVGFAVRCVPKEQREPWLWAAVLVAFNPIAVLMHRKIWPTSIMPIFVVLFLMAWWYRKKPWGAFFWGVTGAFMGQVHPAGIFLAFAFFLWTLIFDERRQIDWRPWLVGSFLAGLSLIPWLVHVFTEMSQSPISQRKWGNILMLGFWKFWVIEPLGISLDYSLKRDFPDFLRYPLVAGHATYLVALAHLVMLGAGGLILLRAARSFWIERQRWREMFLGRESETAFMQSACLWGFGIVFTATLLPVIRPYMILMFPFMFLWLARLALWQSAGNAQPFACASGSCRGAAKPDAQAKKEYRLPRLSGRTALATLCVAQLVIAFTFLYYVHVNQRFLGGDYGVPYRAQLARQAQGGSAQVRPDH